MAIVHPFRAGAAAAGLAAWLTAGAALAAAAVGGSGEDAALSALLKAQTQAFSEAGQRGDTATMARYLDDDVVFTNETGAIVGKADMIGDGSPPPPAKPGDRRHIEVTHWALRRQGDVATATFIDELVQDFHGQRLDLKFQSTETWAKRPGGWKMIASHTMNVPKDPPAVALPAADLDAYVGTYQLDPQFQVKISHAGDGLASSANGAPPTPLKAELRDVLFTPGAPNGRRIIQRDASGRVIGYISRRDGNDLVLKKVA